MKRKLSKRLREMKRREEGYCRTCTELDTSMLIQPCFGCIDDTAHNLNIYKPNWKWNGATT